MRASAVADPWTWWGVDLDLVLDYLEDPGSFHDPEVDDTADMP